MSRFSHVLTTLALSALLVLGAGGTLGTSPLEADASAKKPAKTTKVVKKSAKKAKAKKATKKAKKAVKKTTKKAKAKKAVKKATKKAKAKKAVKKTTKKAKAKKAVKKTTKKAKAKKAVKKTTKKAKAKKAVKKTTKKAKVKKAVKKTTKKAKAKKAVKKSTKKAKAKKAKAKKAKPSANLKVTSMVNGTYPNDQNIAKDIHLYVNQLRAKNGLKPLAMQKHLSANAIQRAKLQAEANGLSHANFERAFDGTGLDYLHSENLADSSVNKATSDQELAKQTVQAWYVDATAANKGHRKNMLCPLVTTEGIGVYRNGNMLYVAEDFANAKMPSQSAQLNWINYFNGTSVKASKAL